MEKPINLKYLFIVEYDDATSYKQGANDKSSIDPKRSEFYDVLHSGKTIKRFSLFGDNQKVTVDLQTGLFDVNGLPILLESEKLPTLPEKFELIFYRQWTVHQNVTYATKTGKTLKREDAGRFCEYFIGWKCTINGKMYQQKLAIA